MLLTLYPIVPDDPLISPSHPTAPSPTLLHQQLNEWVYNSMTASKEETGGICPSETAATLLRSAGDVVEKR